MGHETEASLSTLFSEELRKSEEAKRRNLGTVTKGNKD
jgi:hypothetical protein